MGSLVPGRAPGLLLDLGIKAAARTTRGRHSQSAKPAQRTSRAASKCVTRALTCRSTREIPCGSRARTRSRRTTTRNTRDGVSAASDAATGFVRSSTLPRISVSATKDWIGRNLRSRHKHGTASRSDTAGRVSQTDRKPHRDFCFPSSPGMSENCSYGLMSMCEPSPRCSGLRVKVAAAAANKHQPTLAV